MRTKSAAGSRSSSPQDMLEKAVGLHRQRNFKGAVKWYRRLLKQTPDNPQVLNMCGLATGELGDLPTAVRMLEKSVRVDSDYADGWLNLGAVRQRAGDHEAAIEAFTRARALAPDDAGGHVKFANACQMLDRQEDAVAAYERALDIDPSDGAVWRNLSRAALVAGAWEKSVKAADRSLEFFPGNTGVLAIKATALLELGEEDALSGLVDFDRLIQCQEFSPPAGYADMASFNDALCAHCLDHPSLTFEPGDNTTMKGHQTGNLADDEGEEQGPIADLLAMIDDAVRAYQETHPVDADHPFLARHPQRWNTDIWATVLGSQGHQAPHIHLSGWLSGCYYARIPDCVSADDDDKAGWIEFGRPHPYPKADAEPIVQSYQPTEGMVVLFPSYFYHRTEPFVSDEMRISIAFDIIPIPAE